MLHESVIVHKSSQSMETLKIIIPNYQLGLGNQVEATIKIQRY
jgi:hypothetical protein